MDAHQYAFMRTTIELPDALLKRAKLAALENGTTLKQMVREALEMYLDGGMSGGGNKEDASGGAAQVQPKQKMTRPMVETGPDSPIASMDSNSLVTKEGKIWKQG